MNNSLQDQLKEIKQKLNNQSKKSQQNPVPNKNQSFKIMGDHISWETRLTFGIY